MVKAIYLSVSLIHNLYFDEQEMKEERRDAKGDLPYTIPNTNDLIHY